MSAMSDQDMQTIRRRRPVGKKHCQWRERPWQDVRRSKWHRKGRGKIVPENRSVDFFVFFYTHAWKYIQRYWEHQEVTTFSDPAEHLLMHTLKRRIKRTPVENSKTTCESTASSRARPGTPFPAASLTARLRTPFWTKHSCVAWSRFTRHPCGMLLIM